MASLPPIVIGDYEAYGPLCEHSGHWKRSHIVVVDEGYGGFLCCLKCLLIKYDYLSEEKENQNKKC